MKKRPIIKLLLAATIFLIALPVASHSELVSGTWTGLIDPPSVGPRPLTYSVVQGSDSLSIVAHLPLNDGTVMDITFRDIQVERDVLKYVWGEKEIIITCELFLLEDGSYFGPCPNNQGGLGYMHMVPPDNE